MQFEAALRCKIIIDIDKIFEPKARLVAHTKGMRNAYEILVGKP
jgi:hypothetical protein